MKDLEAQQYELEIMLRGQAKLQMDRDNLWDDHDILREERDNLRKEHDNFRDERDKLLADIQAASDQRVGLVPPPSMIAL